MPQNVSQAPLPPSNVVVTTSKTVPQLSPAMTIFKNEINYLKGVYGVPSFEEMKARVMAMRKTLIQGGAIENIPVDKLTEAQVRQLIEAIRKNFPPEKTA